MAIDVTKRKITKINREVSRLTAKVIKNSGVGTAEIDFIHVVRKKSGHNPKTAWGIFCRRTRELWQGRR